MSIVWRNSSNTFFSSPPPATNRPMTSLEAMKPSSSTSNSPKMSSTWRVGNQMYHVILDKTQILKHSNACHVTMTYIPQPEWTCLPRWWERGRTSERRSCRRSRPPARRPWRRGQSGRRGRWSLKNCIKKEINHDIRSKFTLAFLDIN